ncbi:MAG: mechanosensitive ion channel domain-containing protein, partial [Cyanobacteria bacterium P01_G01_bin.49]
FVAIGLNALIKYEKLYTFLGFIVYFILSFNLIWFASKITRQIIHRSVIVLVQRWFGEVNEVVLVFETLVYVLIILSAIIIFAVGLRVNLVALITSLGIGGVAVAFGAQQTISRLFGTMELYLDRPYVSGEYIRVNFNPYGEDVYGRVESVGLRSTKIRIVAQNTLMIVPNSVMADKNIENISRGKKIMAMLCLDFIKSLEEGEKALVSRTVEETSEIFWGFDRASTRIQFCPLDNQPGTRTRVIFFISSSSRNSLDLRKRLLDLANDALARKLAAYNLKFTVPEPVVYIDSPMSI